MEMQVMKRELEEAKRELIKKDGLLTEGRLTEGKLRGELEEAKKEITKKDDLLTEGWLTEGKLRRELEEAKKEITKKDDLLTEGRLTEGKLRGELEESTIRTTSLSSAVDTLTNEKAALNDNTIRDRDIYEDELRRQRNQVDDMQQALLDTAESTRMSSRAQQLEGELQWQVEERGREREEWAWDREEWAKDREEWSRVKYELDQAWVQQEGYIIRAKKNLHSNYSVIKKLKKDKANLIKQNDGLKTENVGLKKDKTNLIKQNDGLMTENAGLKKAGLKKDNTTTTEQTTQTMSNLQVQLFACKEALLQSEEELLQEIEQNFNRANTLREEMILDKERYTRLLANSSVAQDQMIQDIQAGASKEAVELAKSLLNLMRISLSNLTCHRDAAIANFENLGVKRMSAEIKLELKTKIEKLQKVPDPFKREDYTKQHMLDAGKKLVWLVKLMQ